MDEIDKEERFRKKTDSLALGIRNACGECASNILKRFIKNDKYKPDGSGDQKFANMIMPELMIYTLICFYAYSNERSKKFVLVKKLLGKKLYGENEIEIVCDIVKTRIIERFVSEKFKAEFENSYTKRMSEFKISDNFRSDFITQIKVELNRVVKGIDSTDMIFVMYCIDRCVQEVVTGDYKK